MSDNDTQMTEPMSKEEMIDILKGLVFGTFDKTTAIEREALDMAIKVLDQTRWIPVLERSPEKSGKYLAYIINKKDNKLQYIMTCEYLVDGYWHWFPDDECASDNVIAWMPLPEPYKPQESEGEE